MIDWEVKETFEEAEFWNDNLRIKRREQEDDGRCNRIDEM